MGKVEEPPRTFTQSAISYAAVTTAGKFEVAALFNWQPMQFFETRRYPGVSITVYDNPSKCIWIHLSLHMLKLNKRLKIDLQYSISPRYCLFNLPEITHLNKYCGHD